MNSAENSEPVSSAAPGGSGGNGIREWFWRGRALEQARQRAAALPGAAYRPRRERLRRARLAAELGDRAGGYDGALQAGSALPLSISLYREAAYWALLARSGEPGPRSLAEAFEAAGDDLLDTGLNRAELATVRRALAGKTFIETAEDGRAKQRSEAELCRRFVHALIESGSSRKDPVVAVLVQRWVRLGAVLLVVAGLLCWAAFVVERARRGPDLVAGRPWKSSSQAYQCRPHFKECGGITTAIFFHTRQERKPWLEIDLGAARTLARVEVENRDDCCRERAVPLVVSVSDDAERWEEVARRRDSFRTWQRTFAPVRARYLRLHVNRRSTFHLVRVSAWAR